MTAKAQKMVNRGNMYQYLGADEQERQSNLAQFKNWVGNLEPERWADTSKDELNR